MLLIFFYSDPKFSGLIIVFCDRNCKLAYHELCWKRSKNDVKAIEILKVTDKVILMLQFIE
jgi:hypothetical protein